MHKAKKSWPASSLNRSHVLTNRSQDLNIYKIVVFNTKKYCTSLTIIQ